MEKLDQMAKDFHLYSTIRAMETRKWSEDEQERRSKDFIRITALEKRPTIRRIYRSLESFGWRKNKRYCTTADQQNNSDDIVIIIKRSNLYPSKRIDGGRQLYVSYHVLLVAN
ncbi:hypothetical protein Tco_0086576 [Tanacetum coccineum]